MPRGGARNRSGPRPDENSLTSAARGLVLTALPPGGYEGEPPAFPLPRPTARERAVWEEVWRTPQACVWASQPWRHRTVAMWARWSVRMEAKDSPASLGTVVVRLAEKAEAWRRGRIHPLVGSWCDGYIILRGTFCEPLSVEVVHRLNRLLAESHRALPQRGPSSKPVAGEAAPGTVRVSSCAPVCLLPPCPPAANAAQHRPTGSEGTPP